MAELYLEQSNNIFGGIEQMRNATLEGNRSDLRWFALYTRHRFEKKVAARLEDKGIESFLPLHTVLRQWSDRRKKVEEPLFNCYVFVHINHLHHPVDKTD